MYSLIPIGQSSIWHLDGGLHNPHLVKQNPSAPYTCCNMSSKNPRKMTTIKLLHTQSFLVFIILNLLISHTTAQSSNMGSNCQPVNSYFCNIENYQTVSPFTNILGHDSLDKALAKINTYTFLLGVPHCVQKIQLFLCSLHVPICLSTSDIPNNVLDTSRRPYLLPCKEICEEAKRCDLLLELFNSSWPDAWNCDNFNSTKVDKMCVINNQENQTAHHQSIIPRLDPLYPINGTSLVELSMIPNSTYENASVCGHDLFDCRSLDPKKPVCIDPKFVCDGNQDCRSGGVTSSMDEADCDQTCKEGQIFCDRRCILRQDVCNGIPDCISGEDEQNCIDNPTTIIQSILCVLVMISAIYVLVRFYRMSRDFDEKNQSYGSSRDVEDLSNHTQTYGSHKIPSLISQEREERRAIPLPPSPIYPPLTPSRHCPVYGEPLLHSCRESSYQAPSMIARSDYDREIPGGYSGASSIYDSSYAPAFKLATVQNYGPAFKSATVQSYPPSAVPLPPLTPPAPPPTPALDKSGSRNLYENMDDDNDSIILT